MSFADTLAGAPIQAGRPGDAVNGVVPTSVVRPADATAVAAVLAEAARRDLAVVPRGAGTKLAWGAPPTALDLVLDLSALDAVVEFAPDDLVVRVQAGVRLADLQSILRAKGLCLAVDEVVPGSTIGGVIATALSGPSRYAFGAVRDLLIGITVIRADGVVAKSGGRVVKNVAGYDLCKLYTGSYGTLGVITEAIFRLHPAPEEVAYVSADYPNHDSATTAMHAVMASKVVPSAIEFDRPRADGPTTVCVLLEGSRVGVTSRAATVAQRLDASATTSDRTPSWWGALPGPATIRLTTPIDGVARVVTAAQEAAIEVSARGSAGGILHVGFADDRAAGDVARLLAACRRACAVEGGFATLLRAPVEVASTVDVWGPVPGLDLMRHVKDTFDPGRRLSPGRFVGGI
jgi:glycolate oxidase FAD binding subunit